MTRPWQDLVDVRERRRASRLASSLAQARAAQEQALAAQQADRRVDEQVEAQSLLWRSTGEALVAGGSVHDLRAASAWSAALDTRIAVARTEASSAHEAAARQQGLADEARRALVQASGQLEKARHLQTREYREQGRRKEHRDEDAAGEQAVQAWVQAAGAKAEGLG